MRLPSSTANCSIDFKSAKSIRSASTACTLGGGADARGRGLLASLLAAAAVAAAVISLAAASPCFVFGGGWED